MTTSQILIKEGLASAVAQISFATHANYAPDAGEVIEFVSPAVTQVSIEMAFLNLGDGTARQSVTADLGVVRATEYLVKCALEWDVSVPTTAKTVDFYWAGSDHATAATGLPGNALGTDSVYDGAPATLAEGLGQLIYIGSFQVSADQTVQTGDVGVFSPRHRYGSLIVVNNSGQTIADTDSNETAVVMNPVVEDIAAAA